MYKKRDAQSVSRTPLIQARPIFRSELQIEPPSTVNQKQFSSTPTMVRRSQILYPRDLERSTDDLRNLPASRSCSTSRFLNDSSVVGSSRGLGSKRFSVAGDRSSSCYASNRIEQNKNRPCSIMMPSGNCQMENCKQVLFSKFRM